MGAKGFQVNLDGSYSLLIDSSTEDDFLSLVPQIGPLLIDGWKYENKEGTYFICMHESEEDVEGSKVWWFDENMFREEEETDLNRNKR